MRVVIAGGHGKIARILGSLLVRRGDEAVGIVRNPDHLADLSADGIEGAVLDLERAGTDEVASVAAGADALVFAAGAGPGSGLARKETVDHAAAVLVADAAERAAVPRVLQVSSMGVDSVRGGASPAGVDEVFVAYLRAKLAAEEDLRGRSALDWIIVRPGMLTDDAGTGTITLAESVRRGRIPRADVAATVLALLDEQGVTRRALELVGGSVPIDEAVRAVAAE